MAVQLSGFNLQEYKDYQQRMKMRLSQNEFESFSALETLEVLLLYATSWRNKDIRPIAKELLKRFLTIRNVLNATPQQLLEIKNLSLNEITLLKVVEGACFQLLTPQNKPIQQAGKTILNLCRFYLSHQQNERLLAIYLDKKLTVLATEVIQTGSQNKLPVFPRQIMQYALNSQASTLILAHNHPSGEARASQEDLTQTRELKRMLGLVNISLTDHLIIANNQIYSIRLKKIITLDEYEIKDLSSYID